MLIRSLQAINFRKYHKLEIKDIPQRGVITVAGLNESGKTSIGESICFALYGRTFSLNKKNLHKVICWGQETAEVTLKFSAGDAKKPDNYTLYRSVDIDGNVKASLLKEDSEDVILDTPSTVSGALMRILGYDFNAFSNSFYLAQRELTTPDPESDTIKKMAGIGDYARLHDEFVRTNETKKEIIAELAPEVALNQKSLDKIKLDETWLPELVDAEQTLDTEKNQRESLVTFLDENENTYAVNAAAYAGVKTQRTLFSILSFLLLPVLIISWLLLTAKKYFPDALLNIFDGFFSGDKQSWFTVFSESWLLPVAVLSSIGFLISWWLSIKSKATMKGLDEEASIVTSKLEEGHQSITTQVEMLLPERVVKTLSKHSSPDQKTLVGTPEREQFANLPQLMSGASGYQSKPEEVTAAMLRMSGAIKRQDADFEMLNANLLEDIGKEKLRSDDAGALRSTIRKLGSVVEKSERIIEVNDISTGLLQRAATNAINIFNKNIATISANTLPKFTEGRYKEINIADDLSVRVYSDDKKDYMDFDEISSGTQRQIMLALRMAMSEELATNTGNTEQFIFLDEPFAFFDEKRTVSTLRALPDVSKVISQVWVVAQAFPDIEVSKTILCPVESSELIV